MPSCALCRIKACVIVAAVRKTIPFVPEIWAAVRPVLLTVAKKYAACMLNRSAIQCDEKYGIGGQYG